MTKDKNAKTQIGFALGAIVDDSPASRSGGAASGSGASLRSTVALGQVLERERDPLPSPAPDEAFGDGDLDWDLPDDFVAEGGFDLHLGTPHGLSASGRAGTPSRLKQRRRSEIPREMCSA